MATRKRIRNLNVTFVSLLERGANRVPGLLKEQDGGMTLNCLTKADVEGKLHVLVYVPDMDDAHGHYMTREDVRQACHSHARNGSALDLRHDCTPLEKESASVVEHFILQQQDERFPQVTRDGKSIDHVGAWADIIEISDTDLLAKAQAGELGEVSLYAPAGGYELVDDDEPTPAAKTETDDPTYTMTPEEIQALMKGLGETLSAGFAAQTEALTKALTPEPKTSEAPKGAEEFDPSKPPMFKGDPTSRIDRLNHRRSLEDWALAKQFVEAGLDLQAMAKTEAASETLQEARKEEDKALGIVSGDSGSLIGFDLGKTERATSLGSPEECLSKSDVDAVHERLLELQKSKTSVVKGSGKELV